MCAVTTSRGSETSASGDRALPDLGTGTVSRSLLKHFVLLKRFSPPVSEKVPVNMPESAPAHLVPSLIRTRS